MSSEQLPLFDVPSAMTRKPLAMFQPIPIDHREAYTGVTDPALFDIQLQPNPTLVTQEVMHRPAYRQPYVWRRIIASTMGAVAAGSILSIGYALTHAEVKDDESLIPATITPQYGSTTIDAGVGGKGNIEDLTKFGLGVNVKLDGPPAFLSDPGSVSLQQIRSLARPYVGQYGDFDTVVDAYATELQKSERIEERKVGPLLDLFLLAGNLGASALAAGGPERRRRAMAAGVLPGLLSLPVGGAMGYEWVSDHQVKFDKEHTYHLPILNNTPFEGMVVDNFPLSLLVNKSKPIFEQEKARENAQNAAFLRKAYDSIDASIEAGAFVPPTEGERTVLIMADLHSNQDMIKVYTYLVKKINEKYGADTITLILFAGDQTYGSTSELGLVKAESRMARHIYFFNGNHDGPKMSASQEEAGEYHLGGKTVTTPEGVSVLGADDPDVTPVHSLLSGGQDVPRYKDGRTEEAVGDALAAEAEKTHPAFMLNHEAYTQKNVLRQPSISEAAVNSFFSSCRRTDRHGELSPIQIPAGLTGWGHWHRKFQWCRLRYADGRWGVVAEFDAAGGVPNGDTLGISFPFTVPAKQASVVFATVNVDSELITKLQEFTTQTNGLTQFQSINLLGTPPTDDSSNFPVRLKSGKQVSVTAHLPKH